MPIQYFLSPDHRFFMVFPSVLYNSSFPLLYFFVSCAIHIMLLISISVSPCVLLHLFVKLILFYYIILFINTICCFTFSINVSIGLCVFVNLSTTFISSRHVFASSYVKTGSFQRLLMFLCKLTDLFLSLRFLRCFLNSD